MSRPLEYLSRLLSMARQSGGPCRMVVAAAAEEVCLESVVVARQESLIEPVLFGDRPAIEKILLGLGQDPAGYEIHHFADPLEATRQAVCALADGRGQLIMKGLVQTGDLFHAYFDKSLNLRQPGRPMSHIGLFEVPGFDRLFAMTDAALNVEPDEARLVAISRNAVEFMHRLGWVRPRVALLAASSKVNARQPVTERMQKVMDLAASAIPDAVFCGPLAIDEAISARAAKIKCIEGAVSGDADILVVPSLEVGNVLYKTLTVFAQAKVVGAVLGGRAPVVLTSRADSEEAKLETVALSCLMARGRG